MNAITDTGKVAEQADAWRRFRQRFPEYDGTRALDRLRDRDFGRLDRLGQVYLDWTGGALYGESQVRRHARLLSGSVLGNPHSSSPASRSSELLVTNCRRQVLDFFHASPREYQVVFTANASHALKLVGESYPFGPGDRFLLTYDNHNSVNGIREYDRASGARTVYVPVLPPGMRADQGRLEEFWSRPAGAGNNLFAFPAQSNFSGVQHPLEWIEPAQLAGWDVLLDAAAFVPTNPLDLSRWHPDYVALSFYKMFGYPTGVGALLARRPALHKLHRPWFSGGTIRAVSVQADRHLPAAGSAAFEDGTINSTSLPAVCLGLEMLSAVGMETIHRRVRCLTGWLLDELARLRHPNGAPRVLLYGPGDTEGRGGTLAFNLLDAAGRLVDHRLVELQACRAGISLRTGCFCNPGAGEAALGLTRQELEACFEQCASPMTCDDFRSCLDPAHGSGAVRVSLGMVSNFADVQRVLAFLGSTGDP